MTHDPQTRRQVLRRSGAALAAAGGVGLAATNASAQTGDSQSILMDGLAGDVEPDYEAFADGFLSQLTSITGPPEDIDALATDAKNEFNANAQDWISYGNWLLDEAGVDATGDTVVGVEFRLTRGRWPTRDSTRQTAVDVTYDEDAEEFTGLEWTDDDPDDPDFQVQLKNRAAENAADELATFRRKWIGDDDSDHEQPDDAYLSRMYGKYTNSIGFGERSQSVIELLLGEVQL